ncbi:hypothetical protein ACFOZY_13400 [Chungangia koreensis]|uniref:Sulfite exporter TauE/SafE family protein n=1 Tax=Chungangia koreensis TaxID=752657 RepID=A0ABV8X8I1_9LACT
MGSILLFSLIVGIITTVLILPLFTKEDETEPKPFSIGVVSIIVLVLLFTIGAFILYYFTNQDRNWSSLWPLAIIVTGLGMFVSKGMEQKVKGVLFLSSLVFGIYIMTAPLFNADEKYESVEMAQKEEITPFDETKTPASVPPDFARNKMRKAFGQVPNTSYYELGSLQIQKVAGEFVYIAPVEFSGFFRWLNGDTTPGYFTMSATDSSDNPKFIKSEMAYTPSSYFHKNLERHMRMNNPNAIFHGDAQLEIDDEGKPHYIRSYGEFISARNGFTVHGIVMVDPATGDTETFSLDEVPEFIDGAVAPEAVSLQNSYYGNYVHGFWNSKFGKKDVKIPSDEGTEANVSPIFGEDGVMYYFTDFTSPKEGVDSMLGYSLTNGRTGESTYYTGNLEESYMDSAGALQIIEKRFIEKEWHGEMPVLYNFYGEASWLTPVLDSNGFLQNYFIVSAANPEISAYATTPNEALKLYKTALQRGGSSVDGTTQGEDKNVSGSVVRVFKERVSDYTLISFYLDNKQNFVVSSETSPLAIYLEEGDQIEAVYMDTGEMFLPVKELNISGLE